MGRSATVVKNLNLLLNGDAMDYSKRIDSVSIFDNATL